VCTPGSSHLYYDETSVECPQGDEMGPTMTLRSLNRMQTVEESKKRLPGNMEVKGKWEPYIH
jgi:hypothetical protein